MKLLPDGRKKAPLARASKSAKKSAIAPPPVPREDNMKKKAPVARASKSAKKSANPPEAPVPVDNMMMKNKKSESQPI